MTAYARAALPIAELPMVKSRVSGDQLRPPAAAHGAEKMRIAQRQQLEETLHVSELIVQ